MADDKGEWQVDGWRNGEWKCPKCGTIIKGPKGENPPVALVKQHQWIDSLEGRFKNPPAAERDDDARRTDDNLRSVFT